MRHRSALIAALGLFACDDADRAAPVTVELGSGLDNYEAVRPDDTLEITEGLQGGYHVFASVRAQDLEPWNAEIRFELFQGGEQIGGATYFDDFVEQDGALVYSGATVFLFEDSPPESVSGGATSMTVRVIDAKGRIGVGEMAFTPTCCAYLP